MTGGSLVPQSLAPFLDGFYERVARRQGVDVAVVISVARGESRSRAIEGELERELQRIASLAGKEQVA